MRAVNLYNRYNWPTHPLQFGDAVPPQPVCMPSPPKQALPPQRTAGAQHGDVHTEDVQIKPEESVDVSINL